MIGLILFKSFGEFKPTVLSIINNGEVNENNEVCYLTTEGVKKLKIGTTSDYCKAVEIKDIDFRDSLYHWFKDHRDIEDKKVVYDDKIEEGEIYSGCSWPYPLMIRITPKQIKVKLIF